MKKILFISFFAAMAMMMVACGGGSGSSGNSTDSLKEEAPKPELAPGIPSELAGTVWKEVDTETSYGWNGYEVYFEHKEGDTVIYKRLSFREDNRVVIADVVGRYYINYGRFLRKYVIDSTVCEYTYDAPTGTIKCSNQEREMLFSIEVRNYGCVSGVPNLTLKIFEGKDSISLYEIHDDFDKAEYDKIIALIKELKNVDELKRQIDELEQISNLYKEKIRVINNHYQKKIREKDTLYQSDSLIDERYQIETLCRKRTEVEERLNELREQLILIQKKSRNSVRISQFRDDLETMPTPQNVI